MRCLVRRVSSACVRVERQAIGEIGKGLLVYLGIEEGDQKDDLDWVLKKLLGIRIFDDTHTSSTSARACLYEYGEANSVSFLRQI